MNDGPNDQLERERESVPKVEPSDSDTGTSPPSEDDWPTECDHEIDVTRLPTAAPESSASAEAVSSAVRIAVLLNDEASRSVVDMGSRQPSEQIFPVPVATPTMSPKRTKSRSFVTDQHKLMLMKLCVDNQEKNVYGYKKQFWQFISAKLEEANGLKLKDPQSTVKSIVRGVVKKHRKDAERGAVPDENSELTQLVGKWIARDIEMEAKSRSAAQQKAAQAEIQRQTLLLLPSGPKRKPTPQSDQDDEDGQLTPSKKSRRSTSLKVPTQQEIELMATVDRLWHSMETTARAVAEVGDQNLQYLDQLQGKLGMIEERFSEIRREINKQAEDR